MNATYGKLKELGLEIHSVSPLDQKGRVVIPIRIRKKIRTKKYFVCTFEDMIILKGVD